MKSERTAESTGPMGRPAAAGGPVRMCVGCRERQPASGLIRLQVQVGRLRIVEAPGQGRSAYLCPHESCLEQAVRRRAFSRALRQPIEVDDGLAQEFRQALRAREAVR